MKTLILLLLILLIFLGGPVYILFFGKLVLNQHWRTADRSSAKLAPSPASDKEAVFQIYTARTYGWRGMFAVHTWIAYKPKDAKQYKVYQAIGWNLLRKQPVVDIRQDTPDRMWFGHRPKILFQAVGPNAEKIMMEVQEAITKYPYKNEYRFWPGPNSNTFIAYVIRHSQSIKIRLPVTAIGKDYLVNAHCTSSVSKSGVQCSLGGFIGITVAKVEGLEFNILGFSIALNTSFPFLHLPGLD